MQQPRNLGITRTSPAGKYIDLASVFVPTDALVTSSKSSVAPTTSTETTSTTSSNTATTKSSVPAGAIAGGVIGGLAFIAIAAATIFIFTRRSARSPKPVEIGPQAFAYEHKGPMNEAPAMQDTSIYQQEVVSGRTQGNYGG